MLTPGAGGSVDVPTSGNGIMSLILNLWLSDVPQHARRISGDDAVRRDVVRDDAARPDDGVLADDDVGENRGARSDRGAFLDDRRLDPPVLFRLQAPALARRPGIG